MVGQVEAILGGKLVNAFNKFSSAHSWFQQAFKSYESIRAAHPEAERSHFAAYAQDVPLPENLQLTNDE